MTSGHKYIYSDKWHSPPYVSTLGSDFGKGKNEIVIILVKHVQGWSITIGNNVYSGFEGGEVWAKLFLFEIRRERALLEAENGDYRKGAFISNYKIRECFKALGRNCNNYLCIQQIQPVKNVWFAYWSLAEWVWHITCHLKLHHQKTSSHM